MSSLFSDPPFLRGTTLLNGDTIETDAIGPVAGRSIIGQVKVFQDVNPSTKATNSNRLVYCVAARYKGSLVADASTVAGSLYVFDAASAANQTVALENFSALGTATNIPNTAVAFGVLDEYLTGELRPNDIVWLVVKGPCSLRVTATSIGANVAITPSATAGSAAVWAAGNLAIGQNIGFTNAAAGLIRASLVSDAIA
jgi:hypothetical protein